MGKCLTIVGRLSHSKILPHIWGRGKILPFKGRGKMLVAKNSHNIKSGRVPVLPRRRLPKGVLFLGQGKRDEQVLVLVSRKGGRLTSLQLALRVKVK